MYESADAKTRGAPFFEDYNLEKSLGFRKLSETEKKDLDDGKTLQNKIDNSGRTFGDGYFGRGS